MDKNDHQANYFWSGSLLGVGVGATIALLFGTSSGRTFLRGLIDVAENMENSLATMLENIEDVMEDELKDSIPTTKLIKKDDK